MKLSMPDGKRRTFYGKTRAIAKQKADAALQQIRQGCYAVPDRELTCGLWLEQWFRLFHVPAVKPTTAATDQSNLRVLVAAFDRVLLQKLTTEQVQRFINNQAADKAPETVQRYIKLLRKALQQACRMQPPKLAHNPAAAELLTMPKREEPKPLPVLTRDEQALVMPLLPDTTNGRALRFILQTGLRVSEVCGLQWRDIREDGVHVERNHLTYADLEEDGATHIADTALKTAAGRRVVPLTPTARAILAAQAKAQRTQRMSAGAAWQGGEPGKADMYVFATADGRGNDRHNIARTFRAALQKAGLRSMGPHALRHTFASRWIEQGNDVVKLSKLLGHTNPSFTLKTYCHADQTQIAECMLMMDEMLK